jgi:acyl-[acyl-carrier-protein]-phospholipid O-acyltransferase/long-chain-fatty-acid--[acyl-carrier-protein] ligase
LKDFCPAKLVAVLTKKIDEKEILKKLSQKLPQIAIPKVFVILENMTKMGSGKIDFRKVEELIRGN